MKTLFSEPPMIKAIVQRRGIQNLYHFTRLTNLPGVVRNGLIPRKELDASNIEHEVNDADRHDKCEDGNCLSISFPNYKMFYSLRQGYRDVTWAVLDILVDLLWEKDCAFCFENASSKQVTCIPLENRKGADALESLFAEIPAMPTRAEMNIPDHLTTNPQAEVLVFDTIEPSYIKEIFLETLDPQKKDDLERQLQSYKISQRSSLFNYRTDWMHW